MKLDSCDLAELVLRGGAGQRHRHLTLRVDRHRGRGLRNGDAGLHHVALRGHQPALRVELERAVARVGGAPIRHQDLEEAFAADGEVVVLAGLHQVALRHQPRRADRLHAGAELDAGGQDRALGGGLGADTVDVLVEQVLEFRTLALVAGGAHVGDVVGDDLDVEFLGHHSGRGSVECAHDLSPAAPGSVRHGGELVDRRCIAGRSVARALPPICW